MAAAGPRVTSQTSGLSYVGTLAIGENTSNNRPVVLSMDWAPCPKGLGLNSCDDMVACTGPSGTYIYIRQIMYKEKEAAKKEGSTLINDWQYGWKLMFFYRKITGNLCKWISESDPKSEKKVPGHLVIATEPDEKNPALVLLLKYDRQNQEFNRKIIYRGDFKNPECKDSITDIFWIFQGLQLLIFQEKTHAIHSMRWTKKPGTHSSHWHHKDMYPDGEKNSFHDWVGCPHPDYRQFVTTHSETHFRFYRLTIEGSEDHWEAMPMADNIKSGRGTRYMRFSNDGDWLASLMVDSSVTIWMYYLGSSTTEPKLKLLPAYRIEQNGQPPHHFTWLRDHTLVLSGHDLDSLVVYTRRAIPPLEDQQNKSKKRKTENIPYNENLFVSGEQNIMWERKTKQKMDMKGVPPLNSVKGLAGHPRKSELLCVNGDGAFFHLWKNGRSCFITRNRDFVGERRFGVPSRGDHRRQPSQENVYDSMVRRLQEARDESWQVCEYATGALRRIQVEDDDSHDRLKRIDSLCANLLNTVYDGHSLGESTYIEALEAVLDICKFEMVKNSSWKDQIFDEESSSSSSDEDDGEDEDGEEEDRET